MINKKQLAIGLIALLIGMVFYFVNRPPGDVYFITRFLGDLSWFKGWPDIFGSLGGSLPTFTHVFSFALISAGLLACQVRGAITICLGWMLIDILFELGQKYHAVVNRFVPDWFDGILFLENTQAYFRQGRFDIKDIYATCLGATIAFVVILLTMNRQENK